MKTASKIVLLLAVAGWLWYQGFNEGWRQATETAPDPCGSGKPDTPPVKFHQWRV